MSNEELEMITTPEERADALTNELYGDGFYCPGLEGKLVKMMEELRDAEIGRWQKRIHTLVVQQSGSEDIDGSGTDSDELDYTLGEIEQAFSVVKDANADRDRLLTKSLADACNALADALGLPADQIDPNALPDYVKDVVQAERSRCACVALTTPCPDHGPQTNPIAVLAHAIADEIRKGEPRKCG